MGFSGWARRRATFNHDRLKNGVCLSLVAVVRSLRGDTSDPVAENEFLRTVLPSWPGLLAEAKQLVATFEEEMSPAVLFNRLPLSRCDPHTRAWLLPLVNLNWRTRICYDDLIEEALGAVADGQFSWELLSARLTGVQSDGELKAAADLVTALSAACRRLARAFERFPGTIAVA